MATQDTNIVRLKISSVCTNNEEVAEELEQLAKYIRAGDYGNVRVTCTVMDSDAGVYRYSAGPSGTCTMEIVGLLHWAATKAVID